MKFQNPKDRDGFIEGHMPLARSVIYNLVKFNGYGKYSNEDLVQEAYMLLIKAVDKFDEQRRLRFSTFATKFIRNGIIDIIKHESYLMNNETNLSTGCELENLPEKSTTLSNSIDLTDVAKILTERQYYIFYEYVIRDRTYKDIASELGISFGRVRQIYKQAQKKLKEELQI